MPSDDKKCSEAELIDLMSACCRDVILWRLYCNINTL